MSDQKGTLFIVGTPIGNLKDITLRALEVLSSVDLIAAEDTRRTRKLLSYYNVHKPLISYHEHSSTARDEEIISRLKQGQRIALVTDAGMPGFSDPGFRLIRRVIEEALDITIVPGPSAILSALLISGLPPTPFAFLGFPPARGSSRKHFFERYREVPMTRVIFESPVRLIKTLEEIAEQWENPRVCVAREITKVFEETVRGSALDLARIFREKEETVKGEITIVVEEHRCCDSTTNFSNTPHENCLPIDSAIRKLLEETPTISTKELAKEIARQFGISRRSAYKRISELREKNHPLPAL